MKKWLRMRVLGWRVWLLYVGRRAERNGDGAIEPEVIVQKLVSKTLSSELQQQPDCRERGRESCLFSVCVS